MALLCASKFGMTQHIRSFATSHLRSEIELGECNSLIRRSVTCRIANLFFERIRRISGMVSRQSLVEAHLESLCVTFSYVLCKTTACYISNFFDRPLSNIQLSPKNNSVVLHSSVIPFEIISSSTN